MLSPNDVFIDSNNNNGLNNMVPPFVLGNIATNNNNNSNNGIPNNFIMDENNAMKFFNKNTLRSDSSSSTNSSVISSLFYSDSDLKNKIESSKLFEDDIFFCPRNLLSKDELKKSLMLDNFYLSSLSLNLNNTSAVSTPILENPIISNRNSIITNNYLNNTINNSNNNSNNNNTYSNMGPKFNPYKSKSFNPTL